MYLYNRKGIIFLMHIAMQICLDRLLYESTDFYKMHNA